MADDTEEDQYERAKRRSYEAAKRGAESLRKRKLPRTAYSIWKELCRLNRDDPTIRVVSANTIRSSELCLELLSPEAKVITEARGKAVPKEFQRLTREQAIARLVDERAWAAESSRQLMQLGKEVARLRKPES